MCVGAALRVSAMPYAHVASAMRYLALVVYHGHFKNCQELDKQARSCVTLEVHLEPIHIYRR